MHTDKYACFWQTSCSPFDVFVLGDLPQSKDAREASDGVEMEHISENLQELTVTGPAGMVSLQ